MRGTLTILGLAAALPATGGAATQNEAAALAFVIKADKGFIDDPFALDGERLALLRTDSASFARVDVIDLTARKTVSLIPVGDPQQLFERLILVGAGEGVVVVTRDPSSGRRSAQHYGADGKPLGFAGPVTDFASASRAGQPLLIGWDKRTSPSGETTYTVARHRLGGLGRVGKPRATQADKTGAFGKPPFKIIAWQDGYTQIVGEKPGGYDPKTDVRQPKRAAIFDVLQGAVVAETEIADIIGWEHATSLRRTRPNRTQIVVVSEDGAGLEVVDGRGQRTPLALATPFAKYDPRSLREREDDEAGVLTFGIAVDPLNPEALGRQKADVPFLDLYQVRRRPGAARAGSVLETVRVLRAPLDDRPVSWAVGSSFAVVLRKHKSFARGGAELEVYATAR